VLLAGLGGCGTSLNLDGDSRVFGGVVQDFQEVQERLAQAEDPTWLAAPGSSPTWNRTLAALACADVPLSLVGDTLTLPLTVLTALEEKHDEETSLREGGSKTPRFHGSGDPAVDSQPVDVSTGW
jgi:uncharacterized protein YceK